MLASMVGSAVLDLYDRVLLVLAATTERWDALDAHAQSASPSPRDSVARCGRRA